MKNKKETKDSLTQKKVDESLKLSNQKEDKVIAKQQSSEKPSESEEILRLAVGGFTQAFDALNRASEKLDPGEFKHFAISLLKNLKNAGVNLECLQHLAHEIARMSNKKP